MMKQVPTAGIEFSYDMDNDQIQNENDSFPLNSTVETNTWNCPTLSNPVPANPDPRCTTMRASFASFNDWDGDGISNWDDVDDDGDGIMDILDIDWDCDFDNDADLHDIDGSNIEMMVQIILTQILMVTVYQTTLIGTMIMMD